MTTARTRPRASGQGVVATGLDHEMWLYGEVGWEITAGQFLADLKQANGGPVAIHLNSPGGDLFEGLGIYEALRSHSGHVTIYVDALAASAASVIAMAADDLAMAPGAMLMAHDALQMTYGNEADHLAAAKLLGKASDVIAEIYAARAGGTAAEWRKVMRAETWWTASEAVAAGLADRVSGAQPLMARARQARAQAVVSPPLTGRALAAVVRERVRAGIGQAGGVQLAVSGARGRRPLARRAVPSAFPMIKQLKALR